MRAYSYVQFSIAITAMIVACMAGPLVSPQDAAAKEPDYKMVSASSGGGTSGGGEWRTDDPDLDGQLPLGNERTPGARGHEYPALRTSNADESWVEEVRAMVVRLVRFVGATFSELF